MVNEKVKCPLSVLPPIRLLEVMKVIVSGCYGYQFFLKAMDSAVISLLDSDMEDDERGYALFFLSVLYVKLEQPNPFDGLLDHLKGKLPLSVQFGVLYESDHVDHHSTLLKKQNKNLMQDVKRSPQLLSYVKKLHSNPVTKPKSTKTPQKNK
jgi:hypothetical protein